ncbi:DUF2628 domain-containing protein [Bacillus sp. A301a_S52]|nr:DUF2628 domain-containing protein [Bacillus sp. A301a_S52]
MRVQLKNNAGVIKEVKVGFSWTTLFFGFFPALFRGDLKWATILFIITLVVGIATVGFGAWVPGVVFSFVYNKLFIKDLLDKGYKPANDASQQALHVRGIVTQAAHSEAL